MSTTSSDSDGELGDEMEKLDKEEAHERLEKFVREQNKRGIVYLSRVPPYMKVEKLRHLMSQFGEVDKIYLTPEDAGSRKKRVRAGGNRKQRFTDGWVEFIDRRIAKRVAMSLNNTKIGGKKMGFYHDDIWNLRYIPRFKWRHLTEKLAQERRDKTIRLRAEVHDARKESEEYLDRVNRARAIDGMRERREERTGKSEPQKVRRVFAQKEPSESVTADGGTGMSDAFLTKVFGGKRKRA